MQKLMTLPVTWTFLALMSPHVLGDGLTMDFRIIPAVIKPLETKNVSLLCTIQANTYNNGYLDGQRYYDYTSQQWKQVISTSPKNYVGRIMILKNFQDKMKPVAQIVDTEPNVVQLTSSDISSANGLISSNNTHNSFLQLSWTLASSDTFGKYRCITVSFDSDEMTALVTKSSDLDVGSTLNAQDFLMLLAHEKEQLVQQISKQGFKQSQDINTTLEAISTMSNTEEEMMMKIQQLEKTVENQDRIIQVMQTKFNETITDLQNEQNERLTHINYKLQLTINSGFLMLWPIGSYGLLMPKSGCPVGGPVKWQSGWHQHHTESTDRNRDKISRDNHLFPLALSREKANNFITQHFCIKTEANAMGPEWPEGSYCINKKDNCPTSFKEGYITWDEENDAPLQNHSGKLPDGSFNVSTTTIGYCCREDGPPERPIYLPHSSPFYLYRYRGQCQSVDGLRVTEEFVEFDTENTNNDDAYYGVHPDGAINNIRLELCYYEKI